MADLANDPRIDPRIKTVMSAIPSMEAVADVESRDVLLARASTPEAVAQRAMITQIFDAADNEDIAPSKGLNVTEHTVEKHVKNIFNTLRLPPSPDDHRRVLAVVTYLNAR